MRSRHIVWIDKLSATRLWLGVIISTTLLLFRVFYNLIIKILQTNVQSTNCTEMVKFKENVLCLIQFTTCDKQTWNRTPEVQQSCYHFQLSNLCTKKSFTIYYRYICYQMKEMSVLVLNLVDRRSNSHNCMMGDICELSYGKWDIVGAKQNKSTAFAP